MGIFYWCFKAREREREGGREGGRDQTLLGEAFEKQVTGQPTIPKLIVLSISKLEKGQGSKLS